MFFLFRKNYLTKYIKPYLTICGKINYKDNSKKNTFLPKLKGGLNIKEPDAHNLSMRIKHLKQKENQPPWMHIAIYWLGKDIYNYNKDFYHLNVLKTAKTASFYNRELISYIKTQNPNI